MAQPGQQQRRRRGGLLAVLLLASLLLSHCLLAAATTVSEANLGVRKEGVIHTTAPEEAVAQEAAAAEGDRPERVEMEAINDYVPFGANNRHNPHP